MNKKRDRQMNVTVRGTCNEDNSHEVFLSKEKIRLVIVENFVVNFPDESLYPNWWNRLWIRFLTGWKWERIDEN
jgi:hypothetical protein